MNCCQINLGVSVQSRDMSLLLYRVLEGLVLLRFLCIGDALLRLHCMV